VTNYNRLKLSAAREAITPHAHKNGREEYMNEAETRSQHIAPALKAAGTSRSVSGDQVTAQVGGQVAGQVAAFCCEPQPAKAIMSELGLKHWKTFQTNYLAPLMAKGILERTIPGMPRSRMQHYRTTEAGLAASKEPEHESCDDRVGTW